MNRHENLKTVLAQQPLGLIFDFDGTLSPIAPTSEAARLYPGVAALLQRASTCAYVAIMTGRGIEDGASKVNVEGITYIGTHGLEWSEGLPQSHSVAIDPGSLDYVAPGTYLLNLVEERLAGLPGVTVQRKRVGGSLHYRLAPNREQARQKLLDLLSEPARRVNMRISENKQIIEIRSPLAIDKGQALRKFAQKHALRGLVFAGDDRTDLDAILEMERLRQEGLSALAIVVRHPEETPPELLQHADMLVDRVPGMVALLREMLEMLSCS